MKKLMKLFGVFTFVAALMLFNCPSDDKPPGNQTGDDSGLELWIGFTPFPEDGYLFETIGKITVEVENHRSAATGELTITVGGENPQSFTVDPLTIDSIGVGEFGYFDITALDSADSGDSASITISGNGFSKTILVFFGIKVEPKNNFILFHGVWRGAGANETGADITETTFRYLNNSAQTDVTSTILGWTEEDWKIDRMVPSAPSISVGDTLRVIKLNCKVSTVTQYGNPGAFINALFNLLPAPDPASSGDVKVGDEFNVWLVTYNFEQIVNRGIYLGIRDYGDSDGMDDSIRRNCIPWVVYHKQN